MATSAVCRVCRGFFDPNDRMVSMSIWANCSCGEGLTTMSPWRYDGWRGVANWARYAVVHAAARFYSIHAGPYRDYLGRWR